MAATCSASKPDRRMSSIFERYLTLRVGLCIVAGNVLGKLATDLVRMPFGLPSSAALATVVGVPIEMPVMLMLVPICLKTRDSFAHDGSPDLGRLEPLPSPTE